MEVAVSLTAAQIAVPLIIKNRQNIGNFIAKKIFRFNNMEYNIYATMTMRFKTVPDMEHVSECIINSISRYKVDDKDCSYNLDNVQFTVLPEFVFNDAVEIENLEYDFYPENDNIFIPGVRSFTVYFFTKKAVNAYLSKVNKLITLIQMAVMEKFPVKQSFSFLYLQFDNAKDKLSFQNQLQMKSKNLDADVHFVHSKDTELKLGFTSPAYSLIANIL